MADNVIGTVEENDKGTQYAPYQYTDKEGNKHMGAMQLQADGKARLADVTLNPDGTKKSVIDLQVDGNKVMGNDQQGVFQAPHLADEIRNAIKGFLKEGVTQDEAQKAAAFAADKGQAAAQEEQQFINGLTGAAQKSADQNRDGGMGR